MALTDKQKAYYKAYREANRDRLRAAQKRWYNAHGKDNRENRIETVRVNARDYYHRAKNTDRAREYAIANKEQKAAYHADWQKQHRGELNEYNRKRWFQTAYPEVLGIPDEVASACEICGADHDICMDHCHETNTFRGWLCRGCNLRVERPGCNSKYKKRIAEYLEAFQASKQVVHSSAR